MPAHVSTVSRFYSYDALGRLVQEMDSQGFQTTYTYDANGNRLTRKDAQGRTTSYQYDALNRLTQMTDPNGGITQFSYDGRDNLVSVKDPEGFSTSYTYNGFDDLIKQVSPDTGTTQYAVDANGRTLTKTDARNKSAQYQYDALGRVTRVDYGDEVQTLTYDTATNGVGQLASFTDGVGQTGFGYDAQGRVSQVQRSNTSGSAYGVGYSWGAANRLNRIVYPSGLNVDYTWQNGVVTSVLLNGQPLLSQMQYSADGRIVGWQWANGQARYASSDFAGRPSTLSLADRQWQYRYDSTGNPIGIDDSQTQAASHSFGYDSLDRLIQASIGTTTHGYGYDKNGNRTVGSTGSASTQYNHDPASNRLLNTTGSNNQTYQYDASGSRTKDGNLTQRYNNAGRLIQSQIGTVVTNYGYNALGQRVGKTTGGQTTQFAYDLEGRLLGEYRGTGILQQETVWLGDTPIASVRSGVDAQHPTVYYVWADHLNTPRQLSEPTSQKVVWRWQQVEPFGNSLAEQDPDGDGQQVVYNLRFPGQYYDQETGRHYNYFRDYDPATGRYIESDPIGLAAGQWSTYAYVDGAVIASSDPLGLAELQPIPQFKCDILGGGCSGDMPPIPYHPTDDCVDLAKFKGGSTAPNIKAGSTTGATSGKQFPKSVKDAAKAENPNKVCVYCRMEGTATQVDHAIPRARGGNATLDNAQLACPHCNASKGAKDKPVSPPSGYRGPWPPSHW
ncbi:RHS repeat-associated core domain-containing protein [Jeongeupia sp. USM3]|uniref:RHS repeat-associated core domain-containing protein n=1 Tax=Jeongeupia sp. USM3 TaxID=1906741 RepID=UPI00089E047F|nr:RHS repeat-associated core domain-containing protein [Jeongeupia sp. USM3]AOX99912.1 hypothetical protein BJP62_05230 [Jeongeupia sp. USM3]